MYKDDQLIELVDDLCGFILDEIVHVKGTYHDPDSDLVGYKLLEVDGSEDTYDQIIFGVHASKALK